MDKMAVYRVRRNRWVMGPVPPTRGFAVYYFVYIYVWRGWPTITSPPTRWRWCWFWVHHPVVSIRRVGPLDRVQ